VKDEGKKRKSPDAPAREEALFLSPPAGGTTAAARASGRDLLSAQKKPAKRPKGVADYNQHANFSANLTLNAL
jgi:hypothetical protein